MLMEKIKIFQNKAMVTLIYEINHSLIGKKASQGTCVIKTL